MRKISARVTALLLAAVLCLTLCPRAFAAGGFSDVPGSHWAYDDIMACAEAGIVTGMGDGKFHPNDNVTGIQFIVMLTRTFYSDMVEAARETETSSWYAPNMKVASDIGMLESDAVVNDSAMSRTEMANVLYNVLNREGKLENAPSVNARTKLKDFLSIHYTRTYQVSKCYALGIITGMADGTFSGDSSMTRAQACAVVSRMIRVMNGETLSRPETPAQPQQPQQPETPAQTEQPQQPENPGQTENGKLANGKDATEENVLEMLEELKKEYPTGTVWGTLSQRGMSMYANPSAEVRAAFNCIYSQLSAYEGCGGWAALVSDYIFGSNTGTEVTDISKVRPGDIVTHFNKSGKATHIAIVTSTIAPGEPGNANADYWRVNTTDGASTTRYTEWGNSYAVLGCGKSNANPYTGEFYRFATRYPD